MIATPFQTESSSRGARMLRTAFGPGIAAWLEDPAVVEVMLNPDGRLWVDRLAGGLSDTGKRLSASDGERIIRLMAHHVGAEVQPEAPRVSAELPGTGEHFEGLLPPVVSAPAFAIRKPAVAVLTLQDYVSGGILSADASDHLCPVSLAAQFSALRIGGSLSLPRRLRVRSRRPSIRTNNADFRRSRSPA